MTRSAPAFQFYAEDFFCGVVDMTDEECGIYIKLLAVCWSKDGVTEAMIRTVTTNSEAALSILKAKFDLHDDGRFRHKRLVEQRELHEKRKSAGSKGGSKTQANGQANSQARRVAKRRSPTPSPSPTPITVCNSTEEISSAAQTPPPVGGDMQAVVDYWNSNSGTKPVRKLTRDRQRKLGLRLRDCDWPWREAIDKVPIPNTEAFTWQPDFDYLIANDSNAYKLAEGKFDKVKKRSSVDSYMDQFRTEDE